MRCVCSASQSASLRGGILIGIPARAFDQLVNDPDAARWPLQHAVDGGRRGYFRWVMSSRPQMA